MIAPGPHRSPQRSDASAFKVRTLGQHADLLGLR
jgi:hypothetical protein